MNRVQNAECGDSRRDSIPAVPIDRVHGGGFAERALDFSVSINPLGPPQGALEAYHAAAEASLRYPAPYADVLARDIARWLGLPAENVLVGNGTTQLIYLVARELRPRVPFVVIPTFSEIANALATASLAPRAIALCGRRQFRIEPGAVRDALRHGADAVFIGRPNSPTGTTIGFDEAAAIARETEARNAWCVFDEAFIDFVAGDRSAAELAVSIPRLVVLRSLTKIFAIPGLRIGCLLAHAATVARLRCALEPWSVNAAADAVARACLADADRFIRCTREAVATEREYLARALGEIAGIEVFPSVANFLLIKVRNESAERRFGLHMLENGVAVRDLSSLPGCGRGFYRIGIRMRPDNQRLIALARKWEP